MAAVSSLCVFCGAQTGRNPAHVEAARSLGTALARRGITLIYGAGGIGLMGELADAVLAEGGKAVGVIPEQLEILEVAHRRLTETLVTEDMFRRKQIMMDRADGFVVLPGGFGSLDEFFEVLTWKQLGFHDKPVIVLDSDGFWEPLFGLLEHVRAEGFAPRVTSALATVVRSTDELFRALDNSEA